MGYRDQRRWTASWISSALLTARFVTAARLGPNAAADAAVAAQAGVQNRVGVIALLSLAAISAAEARLAVKRVRRSAWPGGGGFGVCVCIPGGLRQGVSDAVNLLQRAASSQLDAAFQCSLLHTFCKIIDVSIVDSGYAATGRLFRESLAFTLHCFVMTSFVFGAFRLRNRLSKALPSVALATTGLLAGASLLSGGQAKAFNCTFGPGGSCNTNIWHDSNPVATDKQILFKVLPTPTTTGKTISGDIEFKWVDINGNGTWNQQSDLYVDQWHVDVDFNSDLISADGQSSFDYIMKMEPPFDQSVSLSALIAPPDGGKVTKQVFLVDKMGSADPSVWVKGAPITSLLTNSGIAYFTASEVWVTDIAEAFPAGSVDSYQNSFRHVPGPLPILGAGAAFGYTRKLRRRLKAARLA